jgi:glutathione S-transferase
METTMILYYYPGACSLADHIALIEAGLDYTLISITHEKKTEDRRDFLSINPKGYIPALELDDGEVLTENIVILNYIAEISGKLLPQTNILRWRVLEALAFMSTEIHGSYAPFFRNFPETEKERAREKLSRAFSLLDSQLDDKKYLICEELTVADFYLFWVLMASERTGIQLTQRLQRYYARMKLLPSVDRALNEEGLN